MSVVRLWVYECFKMVGGTSSGLGVGGWGVGGLFIWRYGNKDIERLRKN